MPKLKGKNPRILEGDNNPRHYIMIPVGTGNQFCCNCKHIGSQAHDDARYCRIFTDQSESHAPILLKINPRLGPERCPQCREAERALFESKQSAHKEGENSAFFKSNTMEGSRSTLFNAAV